MSHEKRSEDPLTHDDLKKVGSMIGGSVTMLDDDKG